MPATQHIMSAVDARKMNRMRCVHALIGHFGLSQEGTSTSTGSGFPLEVSRPRDSIKFKKMFSAHSRSHPETVGGAFTMNAITTGQRCWIHKKPQALGLFDTGQALSFAVTAMRFLPMRTYILQAPHYTCIYASKRTMITAKMSAPS